jgi:hypothetical protein
VERVAERSVGSLQQQSRGEPAAERQAGGADEDQRRQHPERAVQADRLEQPAAGHELRAERQQVQEQVEAAEEAAELIGRDGAGDHALEDVVGERQRDRRDEHQHGERAQVGIAAQQTQALAERGAGRRTLHPLRLGAPERERRSEGGHGEHDRGGEHQRCGRRAR